MKKISSIIFVAILTLGIFTGCQSSTKQTLKVFNWGEYMDMDVINNFEKEFDVNVVYDTFDSNETMYNKIASGSVNYDVLFPSDYMAEKMIKEEMLEPLDFTQIPNMKNINPDVLNADYDPNQTYSVPYFWGTVGILYDKTKVNKPVDSWDILWDETYKDDIFMYNSSRDSMMVALKKLGFSMNTKNPQEIEAAKQELIKQKPLVLGYVGDEVINNMINSQASLAVVYSGDATAIMQENPNMAYAIPKEQGSNMWIDPVVITKNAAEKELAHAFINYLADPEVAKLNTEAVGYSTANSATLALLKNDDVEWVNWQSYNPTLTNYQNMEFFHTGSDEVLEMYNQAWEDVISA